MDMIPGFFILLGYIVFFDEQLYDPVFEDSSSKMLQLLTKYPKIFSSKSIFLI